MLAIRFRLGEVVYTTKFDDGTIHRNWRQELLDRILASTKGRKNILFGFSILDTSEGSLAERATETFLKAYKPDLKLNVFKETKGPVFDRNRQNQHDDEGIIGFRGTLKDLIGADMEARLGEFIVVGEGYHLDSEGLFVPNQAPAPRT